MKGFPGNAWRELYPWMDAVQGEREAILTHALLDLAQSDYLQKRLAMRGGEALQKLCLPRQTRCCDTLSFSQCIPGPIKGICDAIRNALFEFDPKPRYDTDPEKFTFYYRFNPESDPSKRRQWRLVIRTREHNSRLGWERTPVYPGPRHDRAGPDILAGQPEELVAQCIEHLLSRSRGRDLLDTAAGLAWKNIDGARVRELVAESQRHLREELLYARFWTDLRERKQRDRYFRLDFRLAPPDRDMIKKAWDTLHSAMLSG